MQKLYIKKIRIGKINEKKYCFYFFTISFLQIHAVSKDESLIKASGAGNLRLVKELCEKAHKYDRDDGSVSFQDLCTLTCKVQAICHAAYFRHTQVVEYFINNWLDKMDEEERSDAIAYGYCAALIGGGCHVRRLLFSHCSDLARRDFANDIIPAAKVLAALNGQYYTRSNMQNFNCAEFEYAVGRGHVRVVRKFIGRYYISDSYLQKLIYRLDRRESLLPADRWFKDKLRLIESKSGLSLRHLCEDNRDEEKIEQIRGLLQKKLQEIRLLNHSFIVNSLLSKDTC